MAGFGTTSSAKPTWNWQTNSPNNAPKASGPDPRYATDRYGADTGFASGGGASPMPTAGPSTTQAPKTQGGYVTDPDLLANKGGSPGYKPGMQWDVKNQKYIKEPTGHAYVPGKQWRDDGSDPGHEGSGAASSAPLAGLQAAGAGGGGGDLGGGGDGSGAKVIVPQPDFGGAKGAGGDMGGGYDMGGSAGDTISGPSMFRQGIGTRMLPNRDAVLAGLARVY